jgi:hypothetical protein
MRWSWAIEMESIARHAASLRGLGDTERRRRRRAGRERTDGRRENAKRLTVGKWKKTRYEI